MSNVKCIKMLANANKSRVSIRVTQNFLAMSPQNIEALELDPLEWGSSWPPKNTTLRHVFPRPNIVALGHMVRA